MAVAGLKVQLMSFHKGVCFQINAQNNVRALGALGDVNIHPGISFMQWMCVCTAAEAQPCAAGGGSPLPPVTPISLITHELLDLSWLSGMLQFKFLRQTLISKVHPLVTVF